MIQIDPDVFTYQPAMDMSVERFVVRDVGDEEAVLGALGRASDRFMAVDTNGVEHASEESMLAAVDAGAGSPSYVSDPEVTSTGVEVYVDCKGVIEDAMADTLRGILRGELTAVGYSGRVSAVSRAA